MLTRIKSVLSTIMICFILSMITGCGGGSSGDGDSVDAVYTGLTSQAVFDDTNAQQIVEEAYLSGSSSSSLTIPFSSTNSAPLERNDIPLSWYLARFAEDLAQQLATLDGARVPSAMSAVDQKDFYTEDGYGGSISGTLSIDKETGDFSGSFTYNSYSLAGVVSDGEVTVEGHSSTSGMTLLMNFSSFTVSYGGVSQTMNGTASLSASVGSLALMMNIVTQDNTTGKTYWMQDYRIDVVEYDDRDEVSISGLFYDFDYGYVVLSTQQPLVYYDDDDSPSSGIIVATGAQGSAGGSTWAKLGAQSSSTYMIWADTDGDGSADWESGVLYW